MTNDEMPNDEGTRVTRIRQAFLLWPLRWAVCGIRKTGVADLFKSTVSPIAGTVFSMLHRISKASESPDF